MYFLYTTFQPKVKNEPNTPDKFVFGSGEQQILEKRNKLVEERRQEYLVLKDKVCHKAMYSTNNSVAHLLY